MSYDIVKEHVPLFVRRYGDRVIEGSNNVTMVCGTDRSAPGAAGLDVGYGHINSVDGGVGAGAWHLIVGRKEENPNFDLDRSYVYVSMRTDVDRVTSTEDVEFNTNDVSCVITKSDSLRSIARKDIKVIANGTYITLDGIDTVVVGVPEPGKGKILLGSRATEPLIFGKIHQSTFNAFVDAFNALVAAFNAHTHLGNSGIPTSTPIAPGGAGGSVVPNPQHPALLAPPPAGPGIPAGPLNPVSTFVPGGGVQRANRMPDTDLSKVSRTK